MEKLTSGKFDPSMLARGRETPHPPQFTFGPDGTFSFLHCTDFHLEPANWALEPIGEKVFRTAVERYRPSLVVLTGDQTTWSGGRARAANERGRFEEALDPLIALLRELELPFVVTFGNHESEWQGPDFSSRQETYEYYKWNGGRIFVDHDVPSLSGSASGVVHIVRPGETKPSVNLFVMDSGDYKPRRYKADGFVDVDGGYDAIRSDQIEWYEKTSGDVPCLWFQHIVVPDANVNGLFVPDDKSHVRMQISEGGPEVPCRTAPGVAGWLGERTHPASWETYRDANHTFEGRTLYQSWLKMKNLRGAYFGHDHKNNYDGVDRNGIRLGATKCASRWGYNDGNIGVRWFKLRADGSYDTGMFMESHLG